MKLEAELNPKVIRGKRITVPSLTLTLTLIGKSCKIRTNESKKPKGEEGKGVAYLAVVHATTRGKERAGRG